MLWLALYLVVSILLQSVVVTPFTWGLLGDYLGTTWGLLGDYLGTTWGLLGDYLGTTWGLLGDYLFFFQQNSKEDCSVGGLVDT
jgi:hypothetical protein